MAYEASKINNTTIEQRSATLYRYNFPLLVVEVDLGKFVNGGITFYYVDAPQKLVDFDDIAVNFGTTNAKTYCDYLATNGYFGLPDANINTTGLATSALQTAGNASLTTIATNSGTQATAALQTTGNASLSSIDTKLSSQATATLQTTGNSSLSTIAGAVTSDGGHTAMLTAFDPDYTSLSNQLSVGLTTIKLYALQTHDNAPLLYSRVNIGGATQNHNTTTCVTPMTVSANLDKAIAQTFARPSYTPSTTHCCELTMSSFQIQSGVIKRVGMFNGGTTTPHETLDGVWIESNATDNKYYACYSNNNATYTKVELTSLVPYGITVDWSKQQAIVIRYLYLGGTAIQFSIMIGARMYRIAEIQLSNVITTPFILRPNQPIRYEIVSTGGAGTLNQVCSCIYTIGDANIEGLTSGVIHPGAISYASAGTEYAVLAIRKKSTHLSIDLEITETDITVSTAETFQYRLLRNPTVAGTALSWIDVPNTAVEYAIGAANNTLTDGFATHVGSATEASNNNSFFPNNLHVGHSIAGVSDIFVLSIIPRTGAITPTASLNFRQQ